jgi:hypothetical protein
MNTTQRTIPEILNRIDAIKDVDFFGWQTGDLLAYLPYEAAKPHLIAEVTKLQWHEHTKNFTNVTPEQSIREYMQFAWDKANNCRGISAGRSLEHMKAWLWLDGKDDLANSMDDYEYYGKDKLVMVCEEYGIDWKAYDNNEWVNNEGDEPITADEVLGRSKQ